MCIEFVDWLDHHLGVITAFYAGVTTFYAWRTHAMSKIMEKQSVADIDVPFMCIKTSFLLKNYRDNNNYIKQTFNVEYEIRNPSIVGGTLKSPELTIRFGPFTLIPKRTSQSHDFIMPSCYGHYSSLYEWEPEQDSKEAIELLQSDKVEIHYDISYINNRGKKIIKRNLKNIYPPGNEFRLYQEADTKNKSILKKGI
jgi:hypothetical protein